MGLRRFLRLWGVDRAIAFTVLGRGWSVLSGPVNLIFLAKYLSPVEQGFYYTFSNIVGMQIFFELGLSGVIVQFVSHERAKLEWTLQGVLDGDLRAKARLSTLLRKALAWYGVVSLLVVLVVLPAGFLFFYRNQPANIHVAWQFPWFWLVVMEACNLLTSPLFALLEGCGFVAQTAKMRLCLAVAGTLLFWLALSGHWGLLAAPFSGTAGSIAAIIWLLRSKWTFLADMMVMRTDSSVLDWRREIWPFQWKIAISWLSGYFIANLFNPILFAYHGPVAAGQMGMSLSLAMAIWTTGFAWVNTKAAPFGMLIANRNFKALDKLFFPCFWQSITISSVGSILVWFFTLYLHLIHHRWSTRLLDPLPMGLLLIAIVLSQTIASQAVYLRAHKQEPFLVISIISGCMIAAFSYFLGRWFGAVGMMAGYLATYVLMIGVSTVIFMQKRRLWHNEAPVERLAVTP